MDRHLELWPEPRTPHRYARIVLKESLECPFLTGDGWCAIHQQLGAEALSETCASFPRKRNAVAGEMEESLQLSCPEAARLVLLNEDLLGQAFGDGYAGLIRGSDSSDREQREAILIEYGSSAHPRPCLAEIRMLLIQLVRDRNYPLWQRLFLIGQFCQRLERLLVGGQPTLIPNLVSSYVLLAASGALRPAMDTIRAQPAMQLAVILRLIDMRMGRVLNSMRFLDCTREFLVGIQYRPGSSPESLAPAYIQAWGDYCQPLLDAHPYMLENYLINYLFKSIFPFGVESYAAKPGGIFREYILLCVHLTLIQGLLTGMSAFHRSEFNTAQVVRLVQSYGRMVEHHAGFVDEIVVFLEAQSLANAGGIAMLLRN